MFSNRVFRLGRFFNKYCKPNTKTFSSVNLWRIRVAAGVTLIPISAVTLLPIALAQAKEPEQDPDKEVVEKADQLYNEGDTNKLYHYLMNFKHSDNAEILWRVCRATRDYAREYGEGMTQKLMEDAFELVKKALSIDDENFAVHKWYAIMLNKTSEFKGTKEQIQNSNKVKYHFRKAMELNPSDATSIHGIGIWCFSFADLTWYQRKIAAVVFAAPPESTYEEALEYFLQAEEVDPNFFCMNLVMIGKTYLRLSNYEKANEYLIRALEFPVNNKADQEAHDEAEQLMKKLPKS